jgi:hypothetical protein
VDRVGGGAGPGGAKAVAPTGSEPITIAIPEAEAQVSLLARSSPSIASTAPPHIRRPAGRLP